MMEKGNMFAGKYRVKRVIGKGGMGTVYLAWDENLQMFRAIKEIVYEKEEEAIWKKKSLEAEVRVLKQADHPMLPKIIDLLHTESVSYMVMEYMEGQTLEEYIKQNKKATERQCIEWGIQIADVLAYLHQLKPPLLYLDMKPANVILRKDGALKLIDFGAVVSDWRGQEVGQYMGTPGYASAEQIQGGGVDVRSDIYALGATLYHLATGVSPALQACQNRSIREWDITLSCDLEEVIGKATERDASERYQTMEEMKEALRCVGEIGRGRRKNFIIGYEKNVIYTEKKIAGLYLYESCHVGQDCR